jgi:type IV secretion system protein TrbL
MACTGLDAINPLCQVTGAVGGAVSSAADDVFASAAKKFGEVADSAVTWLWEQLNQATSVDLTNMGIQKDLIATGSIAALITFALFLIQVIASALRQDPGGMGRAVRGLGVAFIGASFAVASTQILLGAVDALCSGVVQFALGTNVEGVGKKLFTVAVASIANPAGMLLMSLIVLAAVVIIWCAMMMRKLLIIVSAVFAPIAFSGAASDISKSWVRRWIEFTTALVFSKLILVIIFMIGLSVLDGAGQTTGNSSTGQAGQATTSLAIGALVLLMAGLAPWIAIKMVHFAGDSFHAVHAHAGAATAGAQQAAAIPQKMAAMSSKVGAGSSAGSKQGGVPGGGPASQPKPSGGGSPSGGPAAASGGAVSGGAGAGASGAAASVGGGSGASAAAAGPAAAVVAGAVVVAGATKSAVNNAAEQAQGAGQSGASNNGGSAPPRPPKSA